MTTTPADKPDEASAVERDAIVQMDGVPCVCRFRTVEGAIRHGSETGVLVDPDDPIRECDLHKALRTRVTELEVEPWRAQLIQVVSQAAEAIRALARVEPSDSQHSIHRQEKP
jgi:hypothetical protein